MEKQLTAEQLLKRVRKNKANRCLECQFECVYKCTDPEDPRVDEVCYKKWHDGTIIINDTEPKIYKMQICKQANEDLEKFFALESNFSEVKLECIENEDLVYAKSRVMVENYGKKYLFRIIYIPEEQVVEEDRDGDLLDVSVKTLMDAAERGIITYIPSKKRE